MNVHILFEFKEGPWGGGNQFLKALKNEFISHGLYEENILRADAILFNSYPFRHLEYFDYIINIKKRKNNILLFHRLDGPVSVVRGRDHHIDDAVFLFNQLYADGTIYQSEWIKRESEKMGLVTENSTVIINAPDNTIFYKKQLKPFFNSKIRLIATSWSGNMRKGFDVYQWLDENLDFSRFDMTFVGNSPLKFKHIVHKEPMNSNDLANELRSHDIYITGSKFEPCSNALIEALHCGLPAIAYNNGGNPEIVREAGEVFNDNFNIPCLIDRIITNYESYTKKISLPDIAEVSHRYYAFMFDKYTSAVEGHYTPKNPKKNDYKKFYNIIQCNRTQDANIKKVKDVWKSFFRI